jgi:hypothetical protein
MEDGLREVGTSLAFACAFMVEGRDLHDIVLSRQVPLGLVSIVYQRRGLRA